MVSDTDDTNVCTRVLAWVRATLPTLAAGYEYAPTGKDGGLPDAVVELERSDTVSSDPRFPYSQLQQVALDTFEVVTSIMVENSIPDQAAIALREFAATLREQARRDPTLGGRVFLVSQQIEADYIPQFVEYEDGTRGRQVQIRMTIGNIVSEA